MNADTLTAHLPGFMKLRFFQFPADAAEEADADADVDAAEEAEERRRRKTRKEELLLFAEVGTGHSPSWPGSAPTAPTLSRVLSCRRVSVVRWKCPPPTPRGRARCRTPRRTPLARHRYID